MKNWNKLLALLLAAVMVFGLAATSFAADEDKDETTTEPTTETAGKDEAGDAGTADDADKADDAAGPANEIDLTTGSPEWALAALNFVVIEKKLVALREETGLDPSAPMTRAEFVDALYKLAGSPAVTGENDFTDVADTASYKNAVIWGAANKIVMGNGDGTFTPDSELSREHIAVFLYRYITNVIKGDVTVESNNLADFPDADAIHDWAKTEMNWAVTNKIINGAPDATGAIIAAPRNSAERLQVIVMFYRFIQNVLPAEDASAPAEDAADAADAVAADAVAADAAAAADTDADAK